MLGKILEKSRSSIGNGIYALGSKKTFDMTEFYKHATPGPLPHAPANPYRKRPLKLSYDRNEYHFFRLPSEQGFLLGSWEYKDIFGKRKGIEHSPHIKSQH